MTTESPSMGRSLLRYGGRAAAPALMLSVFAACAPASMPVPETLAVATPLAVEGRQGLRIREHLRFGGYEAAHIDRSWTRGRDMRIATYERERRDQNYTYTLLAAGEAAYTVDCKATLRTRGFEMRGVEIDTEDRSSLDCRFYPAGGGRAWRMLLEEERDRPMKGTLAGEDRIIAVVGTNHVSGGLLPVEGASGYQIRDGAAVLGAVEVLNDGRVWIASAGERSLLGAAAAGLLLLEDLRAKLSE